MGKKKIIENRMVVDSEWQEEDYLNNPCCEICGERIEQEDAVYIPNYGYVCDACLEDSRRGLGNE